MNTLLRYGQSRARTVEVKEIEYRMVRPCITVPLSKF